MSQEKASALGSDQQIERVRELILGPQMRETSQRLKDLNQDMARLQQEITQLSEQLSNQEQEQGKRIQALRAEAREGDSALRTELRSTAQELNAEKMDRSALGDLLIELGTQVKNGGSLGSVLADLFSGELTDNGQ